MAKPPRHVARQTFRQRWTPIDNRFSFSWCIGCSPCSSASMVLRPLPAHQRDGTFLTSGTFPFFLCVRGLLPSVQDAVPSPTLGCPRGTLVGPTLPTRTQRPSMQPGPSHCPQIEGHVISWTTLGEPGFVFGRVQDDPEPPRGAPWISLIHPTWPHPVPHWNPHRILFLHVSNPHRIRIESFRHANRVPPRTVRDAFLRRSPSYALSCMEIPSNSFASVVARRGKSLQVQGGLGRFRDVFNLLHHHHKFVQGLKMDTHASHRPTKRCTRWHV